MNTITKTPYEEFPIVFDFANDLQRGESITSYTKSCVNTLDNSDSHTAIIDSDSQINATKIQAIVKAGNLEETHKITINAVTNLCSNLEIDLLLFIKEIVTDFFSKQPNEEFTIRNDFARSPMVTSDTIASVSITAKKVSDNTDATSDVYESNMIDTPKVYALVKAGLDGEGYLFSIKATSGLSYKYEKLILMRVEEL